MSTHTHAISRHAGGRAVETVEEAGWTLVRRYAEDAAGAPAGLIDLSHRPKALALGPAVDPADGLTPGRARWDGRAVVCCRKPGERFVYDLLGPLPAAWPHPACTDITDGRVLLGLIGENAVAVMRRMAAIDVERPADEAPWFAVTRSHGIWLQIIKPLAGSSRVPVVSGPVPWRKPGPWIDARGPASGPGAHGAGGLRGLARPGRPDPMTRPAQGVFG